MDEIWYWLGPLIGGIVLFALISSVGGAPGRFLQQKFQKLGELKGKTEEEIVAAVGTPQSVSADEDGGKILQWTAAGYHIVLVFDAKGKCAGVSHETQVG